MTNPWTSVTIAPPENSLVDVLFDPSTAESDRSGSMAEFYAPGSTRAINPAEPLIERVRYRNRHFRPLAEDGTELHAIISVSVKQWRLHEEMMRSREAQIACIAEKLSSKSVWIHSPQTFAEHHIREAELRVERRIRAEIARDSERLDWLEKNAPDMTLVGDGWGNRDHWHLVWADLSKGAASEQTATSLREAIDAARGQK